MPVMANQLGARLREHREATGLSVRKAAEMLGLSIGYLSQLETGKITWPNADVRRRIASWLGVSHLEVILLTGELTPDEITTAGMQGVTEADPNDARPALYALIDQVNWYGRPDRVGYIRVILQEMINVDRQYKETV